MKKKVAIQGGAKYYQVSEYRGTFYVYEFGGFFGTSSSEIGQTRSFDDALSIIRSYSGKQITKIENW